MRRTAIGLGFLILGVPILLAGTIVAADPYYLFGAPSLRGFNLVRPFYEPYSVVLKPYQVWRMRPQGVVLGASGPEVGIDPHHPGWKTDSVFNFAIPSSPSYITMLTLVHAQQLGARQAVVSLDFFAFNINLALGGPLDERRFVKGAGAGFARYLDETLPGRRKQKSEPSTQIGMEHDWNEALYVAVNGDVAAAIARKEFKSGREHYELAGRSEHREGYAVPVDWDEAGYLAAYPDVAREVSRRTFLNGFHHYLVAGRHEGRRVPLLKDWNEQLYLAVNQDVASAVARKEFKSGREHHARAGFAENREGMAVPDNWNEALYLQANPDVAIEVSRGSYVSGYHHYLIAGRTERRVGGFQPEDWDEAAYLAANPDVRNRVALGIDRSGFAHDVTERLKLRLPGAGSVRFRLSELAQMSFSPTALGDAISTIGRQSEPASFDDAGMRVWEGQEAVIKRTGGIGRMIRRKLATGGWHPWLTSPTLQYCFSNPVTGATTFDPLRFMLRRAHAEDTDLRLFTPPVLPGILRSFQEIGLYGRYETWLRELVRINEEEAARAGRQPFPLWHFGDINQISTEPIPSMTDTTPMTYFWDYTHYKRTAGDLMLDRIFSYRSPARTLPDDFGVSLTAANVEVHLANTRTKLSEWTSANPELAVRISNAARRPRAPNRQAEATCW